MTYIIKIFMFGLSGAGKTTTARILCRKNFFDFGESKRKPTEEEVKAWKIRTGLVSTTSHPNNGEFRIDYDRKRDLYYINESNDEENNKVMALVVDTCGQERFYDHRQEHSFGAQGIIFVIDASLNTTEENILKILNAYDELRSFYQGESFPPMIIALNKQDLKMEEWEWIKSGEKGKKQLFYQKILCDRMDDFKDFPFVGISALLGWGIGDMVDILFKHIFSTSLKKIKESVFEKEPNVLM